MFKVEPITPKDKWYSLYDKVLQEKRLREAFFAVKKNGGTGGIDRQTISSFQEHLATHIPELSRLLIAKTYRPLPVRRVYIPKTDGKKRPLGIPAIRDRVVQQSVTSLLSPIFERTFHDASYGFRPHRSCHQAIAKIEQYLQEGYAWVVDADIQDFFGTIDHELLLDTVNTQIADGSVLALIRKFLEAGVMEEGRVTQQVSGTPQGGVISPLLSNIYLNAFDWEMAKKGYKLVRYADDWIVLAKTQEEAERALRDAGEILTRKKLTLHPTKTRIVHHRDGFAFLGFWFKDFDGTHRKGPRHRAVKAYRDKIRLRTRRQQPRNIQMLADYLNPLIRGWGNYFRIGDVKRCFATLDSWTRMRLRSFLKKKHALSLSAHRRYPNQFFRDKGFVFLEDLVHVPVPATGQRYR